MSALAFAHPWLLAALLPALLPLCFHGLRRYAHPALASLPPDRPSQLLQAALRCTAALALALLVLAAAGPYAGGGTVTRTGTGAQIVVVFDRSGSMSEPLSSGIDEPQRAPGEAQGESKIHAARRLLLDFMGQRAGDMFGMVAFASSAISVAPLGADRAMAEAALSSAEARSMGFTSVGRALGMALDYFRGRPYTAARLVLLVSDGGAEIAPADRRLLETLFVQRRAALIWIYTRGAREPSVIGESAQGGSSQSLSMHQYFGSIGVPYQVFEATSPEDMRRAIAEVGALTHLPTRYEERLPRRDLAAPLYGAALLLMLLLLGAKLSEVRAWAA